MEELLYLVHRIPYPPDKGDKIRSYHLLKHLAQRYVVHVGAFIDDAADWQHAHALAQLCGGEVKLLSLKPRLATLRSAYGLFSGEPLSLPYYRDKRMQAWVDGLLRGRPVMRALVYSSSMAQYLLKYPDLHRVIDFVDIDSDKWRQYAEKKSGLMRWVYRREARTLFDFEQRVAGEFTASAFVSEAEAALFKRMAPACAARVFGFSNGVDTDYFSPNIPLPSPYGADEQVLVFTGAMDYWANVDAVAWFAREIFPSVHARCPSARFYIVGARPSAAVSALNEVAGVKVTGAVPDTRPYLAHAAAAVAPLRIARGIQNKVLEAMAMGKITVVSPQALEGIHALPGKQLQLADSASSYIALCVAALTQPDFALAQAARDYVVTHYSWTQHLSGIDEVLANIPSVDTHFELKGAA